jgi:hypothetical protein
VAHPARGRGREREVTPRSLECRVLGSES